MTDAAMLRVDTDALRAHAKQIEGLAKGLNEAVQAGKSTANDPGVFGVLCSFFVLPAEFLERAGIAALTMANGALAGLEVGLKGVAKGYDEVDEAVHEVFTKLKDGRS